MRVLNNKVSSAQYPAVFILSSLPFRGFFFSTGVRPSSYISGAYGLHRNKHCIAQNLWLEINCLFSRFGICLFVIYSVRYLFIKHSLAVQFICLKIHLASTLQQAKHRNALRLAQKELTV